jgi:magnesium transporter
MKEFPSDTAGSKMISSIPSVQTGTTISEVEKMLLKKVKTLETIDYVYIIDKKDILRGVISLKEIFRMPKNTKVEKIMKKDLVFVHPLTNQERLVYIALKHGIKSIPVVDKEGRLLGVVTYDTILRIFNQEVHKDIFRFGGLYHKVGEDFNTITASALTMIKSRIFWLVIGLTGGIIAASIVSFFENILSKYLALVAFIPVLVYMSDAAGTQSETLIVRSIALNPSFSIRKWLTRELIVAIFLGMFCGVFFGIISMLGWGGSYLLGNVVGLSMFLSIVCGILISTLLPLILKKLKIDPAIASGPFATIISDILTLAIYFMVASTLLGIWS